MSNQINEGFQPLISIIIPVKDADLNLVNIEKILNQIRGNSVEVILVHDTFTEAPSLNLRALISSRFHENVNFLTVQAGNPGSARNAGLKMVRGQWLTFWDADDEPNLESLISMVLSAQQSRCDICIGSFQIREGEALSRHQINAKKGINQILTNPGIWRFSFRSDLISNIKFPPTKMGEDQVFIIRAQLAKRKIFLSEKIVYTYVKGSVIQSTNLESSRKEILKSLKISLDWYSRQSNLVDGFDRLIISKILLTTLKIYGPSLITWNNGRRLLVDIGFHKMALLVLSLVRVSIYTFWPRATSKLPKRKPAVTDIL